MTREEAVEHLIALPESTRLSRAPLTANDVVVIEIGERLTAETAARIEAVMHTIWPHNKCIVLDGGLKLKIASQLRVQ